MKKLILGSMAAMAIVLPAFAQDNAQDNQHLDVWKRNKGITLSYITHQSLENTDALVPFQYDSKSGFSFSTGNTYLWPRSAGWCGNRLKIGVDARWFDISYVKYNEYPKVDGVQLNGWEGSDYSDYSDYGEYGEYVDEAYDDEDGIDLSTQQLHMGVGLGPAVAFVPFSSNNSALRFLRLNVFAHFNPQASALLYKNAKGDTEASWAFVAAYDLGMNIQWKWFTLGFEARWGKAKYNSLISEDEEDWNYDETTEEVSYNNDKKTSFKNSSFRVSLGFRF